MAVGLADGINKTANRVTGLYFAGGSNGLTI
jgi:hypothetical protein